MPQSMHEKARESKDGETLTQEHLNKHMLEQLTLRWEAWEAEATTTAKKIVRARLHLLFLLI